MTTGQYPKRRLGDAARAAKQPTTPKAEAKAIADRRNRDLSRHGQTR